MTLPIAIDSSSIIKFANATLSPSSEELQSFQSLFNEFHHAQTSLSSNPAHPGPTLKLYIVRQPVPAKHRRGLVENKDWKGLEASEDGEGNPRDIVVVAQKINEKSHSLVPFVGNGIPVEGFGASDTSFRCEDDPKVKSLHSWFVQHYLPMFMSSELEEPLPTGGHNVPADVSDFDSDDDDDDSRESKKVRASTAGAGFHLPRSFRPKVEDGEVHYEIWLVALMAGDFGEANSSKHETLGSKPDILVIIPRQSLTSFWTERVSELLETKTMTNFVLSEVNQGRIGIDYKKIMDEKRDSRKPKRRYVR